MSLPKLNNVEFFTEVPSTKQEIKFRPFTVKEQKALLIAREGADSKSILNSVVNVINDCVLSDINVDNLATFDIEFLFLQIRGQSIGDVIPLKVKSECCNATHDVEVDLKDIKVNFPKEVSPNIQLNDTYGIKLKYPNYKSLKGLDITKADVDQNIEFLARSVEMVYDKDTVHDNFTLDECKEFILSLTVEQLEKVLEFFRNAPSMKHEVGYKCIKCGKELRLELNGLNDFFSLG